MKATLITPSVPKRGSVVPDDLNEGAEHRYVRCNQTMSRLVYRAQVVRQVFGTNVARIFMRLMRVDAGVARRVLRSPSSRLRR
jgi:hypothetical protein